MSDDTYWPVSNDGAALVQWEIFSDAHVLLSECESHQLTWSDWSACVALNGQLAQAPRPDTPPDTMIESLREGIEYVSGMSHDTYLAVSNDTAALVQLEIFFAPMSCCRNAAPVAPGKFVRSGLDETNT